MKKFILLTTCVLFHNVYAMKEAKGAPQPKPSTQRPTFAQALGGQEVLESFTALNITSEDEFKRQGIHRTSNVIQSLNFDKIQAHLRENPNGLNTFIAYHKRSPLMLLVDEWNTYKDQGIASIPDEVAIVKIVDLLISYLSDPVKEITRKDKWEKVTPLTFALQKELISKTAARKYLKQFQNDECVIL